MNQSELKAHIKDAEEQLKQLQRKTTRLEQYITAGRRLLAKDSDSDEEDAVKHRRRRKNSIAARIKPILERSEKALHVSEIVQQLEVDGVDLSKSKNKEATVASALIRNPEDFERVAPNRFTLRGKAA